MGDSGQCYICAVTLLSDHGRMVQARTAVPVWTKHVACAVCAKKVADRGEALIYRQDEWVTVRIAVRELEKEEVGQEPYSGQPGDFKEPFSSGRARFGGTLSP